MPEVAIVDSFAESRQILKAKDYRPFSVSDQYRLIGERIGADFSPTQRLYDLLPVFLSGPRHLEIRRAMATNLAAARARQQQAAEQVIATLPALLVPGQTVDLMDSFSLPLWNALAAASSYPDTLPDGLAQEVTQLFETQMRLGERLRINERLRDFIDADPESAEQRLLMLGQNSLGTKPLIGATILSLHHMFSTNLGKPLSRVDWPAYFPKSSFLATDRIPMHAQANGGISPEPVRRCVVHSVRYSREENDEGLFGFGEHACLGRAISNAVWSMITARLASVDVIVRSSTLRLVGDAPESEEATLKLTAPFINPLSLKVELGS